MDLKHHPYVWALGVRESLSNNNFSTGQIKPNSTNVDLNLFDVAIAVTFKF
jgi:hypothetical protein